MNSASLPGSIVPMVSARPSKVAASSVAARIAAAGDMELTARLSEQLTLRASGSNNDAEISAATVSFVLRSGSDMGVALGVRGASVPAGSMCFMYLPRISNPARATPHVVYSGFDESIRQSFSL
jgi:hypothetical protein